MAVAFLSGGIEVGTTEILVSGGVAALLAALAGGGLKAFGVEVPALSSVRRQVLLALAGLALVAIALVPSRPPAGEPSATASTTRATSTPPAMSPTSAPAAEQKAAASGPTRPEVPNIVDLPFPAARQFLLQNGWAPINMGSPMANENLGTRVQEIFDTGFGEAVSCSGSSLAPCLFRYRNPGGFVLEVVTHGEDLKAATVSGATILDCTARPKPEPC